MQFLKISYVQGEASVVAVVNGDSGKTIQVSWHALCEGNLVIEVQSAFFFRSPFTNYENSFEANDEQIAYCWRASYLPSSF